MAVPKASVSWFEIASLVFAFWVDFVVKVVVVWLTFNYLGQAFSWPRIEFLQAAALFVLCRTLSSINASASKK